MKDYKDNLVSYRFEQAEEALNSSELLLKEGNLRSSINRSYYCMFYAALALLIHSKIEVSKHSGVISAINRQFVKTKLLKPEFGKMLMAAFDLRNKSDYREMMEICKEDAEITMKNAGFVLDEVKKILKKLQSH